MHMQVSEIAVKAVSYRAVSSVQTISLAWFLFGDLTLAGAFGVADMILNTLIYGGFDFAWDRARHHRRLNHGSK